MKRERKPAVWGKGKLGCRENTTEKQKKVSPSKERSSISPASEENQEEVGEVRQSLVVERDLPNGRSLGR